MGEIEITSQGKRNCWGAMVGLFIALELFIFSEEC